jgi:hypothetical protein
MPPEDGPRGHPAQRVSAIPDDLFHYSTVGLATDGDLITPAKAFWNTMYHLRPVAGPADPRIPRILDQSNEEKTVVSWLDRAEQVDGWVGKVAQGFIAAQGSSPLQGPRVKVTVAADDLDSAIGSSEPAPSSLKVSGGMLRGPDGKLYPVVVPPTTNGYLHDCISGPHFNSDFGITPDDPSSAAQTDGGLDPGWVTVDTKIGMTSINPPSGWDRLWAAVSPELSDFGEPAGPEGYRDILNELHGHDASSTAETSSSGLPPDDPFLDNQDGYTPSPRLPLPDRRRQETGAAAVGALSQVDTSLANVVHVQNGALAAYHTTYEHNVDGRTRAVVRLYKVGVPPGGDETTTNAFFGSVDGDGHWKLTPVTPSPPPPGITSTRPS